MNNRAFRFLFLLICALLCGGLLLSGFKTGTLAPKGLSVESKTTASGFRYTIFHKNDLKMDVSLNRPDKNDPNIKLVIAGAYTDLKTYAVQGLYLDHGKVYNKNAINHSLGGGIKILNGDCEIFPTNKGKLLNDSVIASYTAQKASFFQQIQLIEKGTGAKFKDTKLFQRRAIVKMKSRKTAIIESFEHITLTEFTKDLLELGAIEALYTDMGSWDEGWYRDPISKKIITIGRLRAQTSKQCNWVVYKLK